VKVFKLIFSGGGTGGHIYPALAIANCFKNTKPDTDVLFVGAIDKMEMKIVPKADFKIKGLWISGFQRSLSLQNLLFPFKVLTSLLQ
jgi:UDP-N-acetylglucosamine--N-acetylmuramyl-(pentapeptide) pyrophosphoryl-undecaprenol N-acetylglucosamine transferase